MQNKRHVIVFLVAVLLILGAATVFINIRAGTVQQEVSATIEARLDSIELTARADQ